MVKCIGKAEKYTKDFGQITRCMETELSMRQMELGKKADGKTEKLLSN